MVLVVQQHKIHKTHDNRLVRQFEFYEFFILPQNRVTVCICNEKQITTALQLIWARCVCYWNVLCVRQNSPCTVAVIGVWLAGWLWLAGCCCSYNTKCYGETKPLVTADSLRCASAPSDRYWFVLPHRMRRYGTSGRALNSLVLTLLSYASESDSTTISCFVSFFFLLWYSQRTDFAYAFCLYEVDFGRALICWRKPKLGEFVYL